MRYNGKINRKLKLVGYNNSIVKRIPYKLQYENFKLNKVGYEKIIEYVENHYIYNDNIIEENLINDLNTFKTYRDDIHQETTGKSLIESIWSVVVSLVSIIVAIEIGYFTIIDKVNDDQITFLNNMIGNIRIAWYIMAFVSLIYLVWLIYHRFTLSIFYKIKYINNVIYTLETIKEDMDKTENLRAKYKATRNRYSPRAMYERKRR